MREALNSNPVVQMALFGVLAVAAAVLLLGQLGGGSEEAPSTPAPTGASAPTGEPAAPAQTPAPTEPATPAPSEPVPSDPVVPAPSGSQEIAATEGLPQKAVAAYSEDQPMAIFITRPEPLIDRQIERWADRLSSDGGVSVFKIEPREIADWVRIVGPVGVSHTPALVVVKPSSADSGIPQASVSYGFRNYDSVRQAVRDAAYDGKTSGYDPG